MKCGLLLFVVVCTAASVAEDFIKSRPSAPVIAEFQFSTPQLSTKESANTIEHKKKTTKRKTTTAKTTTATTAMNTTTTTANPITPTAMNTTTTAKATTTTAKATTTTANPITPTAMNTTTTAKATTTTAKATTTTAKATTTTAKATTTTAKATTTTAKATTTTAEATTTTAKATTTTAMNTTTTAMNTTTTAMNTTTTAKSTTTTTAKPPQPTSSPTLNVGKYTIIKNGTTCLLAQMALQIRLVSAKVNGTFIVQPNHTTTNGWCLKDAASLNVSFAQGFIKFMYNKNSTGNSAYVKDLSFNLTYPFSTPAGKYSVHNESLHLFAARIGHSYSCKNQSIYMGKGLYLDVTQAWMQAFNFTANNEFGVSDPCPADIPTYSVAIAVGVILLVLIIVVVVAYVVGRRRRASGYQAL